MDRLAGKIEEGLSEEQVTAVEQSADFRLLSNQLNRIREVEPKLVRVTGHVQIERDSLTATGHLLEYFTQQHVAELTGTPHAVRGADDIEGDTLRMFFEEEKLNLRDPTPMGISDQISRVRPLCNP
jgi:lipopolysaccharide export system protein LptA